MTTLLDACREIMGDKTLADRYPLGLSAPEMLSEIEARHPGGFPLVTWLDVHDEMAKFFGRPS